MTVAHSRIVYCHACLVGYAAIGALPSTCPHCNSPAIWRSSLEPRVPYELTFNDKQFLKTLRIEWQEP